MKKVPTPTIACVLKLRPTAAQEASFRHHLFHLTAVYNWAVSTLRREADAGRFLTGYDLKSRLAGHGRKIGINQWALGGTTDTAYLAWRRCLSGSAGQPRFKGRRRRLNSIAFSHGPHRESLRLIAKGRIYLAGIGQVRFHRQHIPSGHIGCTRVIRRASGWHLVLFIQADVQPISRVANGSIGIDPGFASLVTLSTGEKIEHPQEWRLAEARIAQAQRGHRQHLTARLRERASNRIRNRNHHLSKRLVRENALIAFSVDRSRNLARRFGKSVGSAGHYQLRSQLSYKCRAGRAQFIEVASRNSTKACSACGGLTGPSGWHDLKVRTWECACGAKWDRDTNAALNTLASALGTSVEMGREAQSGIAP